MNKPFQSTLFLIAANLIPVYGVFFLGWRVIDLLLLYWAESAMIGFFNLLKILTAKEKDSIFNLETILYKFFAVIFLPVHFGIFIAVFGFVIYLLANIMDQTKLSFLAMLAPLWLGLLCLFLSHGYSFAVNYYWGGERFKASLTQLFWQPYQRLFVMNFTIAGSAALTIISGQPMIMLIFFIAAKTAADLFSHLREHKNLFPQPQNLRPTG